MITVTVTFGAKALESMQTEVSTFNSVRLISDSSNANIAAFWTRLFKNLNGMEASAQFALMELRRINSDCTAHLLAGGGNGAGEMAYAAAYVMKQISPALRKGDTEVKARLALKGE